MAIREVLRFPDPRLRKKAKEIQGITKELQELAQDMLDTMYAKKGIGLAAPQIGESVRLLVMDTRPRELNDREKEDDSPMSELEIAVPQPVVIFNPRIVEHRGRQSYDEGCLSVPTFYETVERYEYVEVHGLDIQGQAMVIKVDGLLSVCLQHEMDHLEGKLFIDRLSYVKSNRIKSRIKKSGYPDSMKEAVEEDVVPV
jgi:peptide deformylase